MRLLAVVSYKGTNYQGWQKQTDAPSIQEEIEKVISRILDTPTTIQGSGRTDTGVHARGQTFHFDVSKENIEPDKLRYSINCLLPKDIHISSLERVSDDFHARYGVKEKHYSYTLYLGENNPLDNELVYTYSKPLDVELLKQALEPFNGKHNFQDFTSKEEDEGNFVRNVSIKVVLENNKVIIHFTGDGFMRYQIRFMVGAAIAVAEHHIPLEYITNHLDNGKNREIIAYKAPGEGLVLEGVKY